MRAALLLFFAGLTIVPRDAWAQGNPLGPEFRVNTYTTNDQAQPSVAADSSGNVVVVWESNSQVGFGRDVIGQRYASSGIPLGAEFRVNTFQIGSHAPSVAADPAGNFVVIWEWEPLESAALLGQRYSSSGAPLGGVFDLGNSNYSLSPAVASDSAGNFVVVWMTMFFPSDDVFGQRYSSSGAPVGPVFRANTYTTGAQAFPSVAADSAGNLVVVWSSNAQDGSGLGIFGQRYASSGAPLGSEFRVNTYTTGAQGYPSIATDPSGNFVAVWESAQDGSGAGIFGQRYAGSGAPLDAEFRVNTVTASDQARPSVAADSSGNFVVVWQSLAQDGSGDGVFGQRYDSSGAPLGPEFLVNTYATNDQAEAAVAADPSGDFVVVWESNLQDGSGIGVFGQRYRPIVPVELMNFRLE
jgi:hypothetical protein